MPVELALYQPEIARNTGTLLRLGACLGVRTHIVHPTGFPLTRQNLKRGALDYLTHTDMVEHDSYARFAEWAAESGRRVVLLTTKTRESAYGAAFEPHDVLLFGRESTGVSPEVAAGAALKLRIPMRPGLRSINVALSAAMVLGEALRQTHHFESLA